MPLSRISKVYLITIVERVKAIFDQFPILEKLVNLFKEIGNFIGEGAEAAADFFAGDQRARSFNDAIIASQNAIKGINEELEAAGRDERITSIRLWYIY